MSRPPRSSNARTHARTAILRAAERIFAEKGLEGARTDEIAKAGGVNKALLFYYFRSKNALFRAVMVDVLEEPHRRFMAILSGRGSEREILLRYVEALFDVLSERPHSYLLFQRFMMANPRLVERLMKTFFAPRFRKVAALIRRGVRHNEFRAVDANQAAISLGAVVVFYFSVGLVMKTVGGFDPFDPRNLKKRKREMIEFVRYGLFKNPEAR